MDDQRSVVWRDGALWIIDQTVLPGETRWLKMTEVDALIAAIRSLAVRGAPALGVAGAYGVAVAVSEHTGVDGVVDVAAVRRSSEALARCRPTAANLAKGVYRALDRVDAGFDAVLAEARAVDVETEQANRAASTRAADIVTQLCSRAAARREVQNAGGPVGAGGGAGAARKLRLLTHCNAGWLATASVGTALGTVTELARRGLVEHVLVDETRPLLQGSRLTSWELRQAGIPHSVCVDSAAAYAMSVGMVDCVIVGADRITADGDVANKIGTYGLAVAAAYHRIPVVVVATEMTVDDSISSGAEIEIEQRSADEVLVRAPGVVGGAAAGGGALDDDADQYGAFNPAFDVTPARLLAAVVTEGREFRNPAWSDPAAP